MRPLQDGPDRKPLAGAIKRVCATDPVNPLPGLWLGFDRFDLIGFVALDAEDFEHVLAHPFLHIRTTGFRCQIVSFVTNGVAAEDSTGSLLEIRTIKAVIRHTCRERRESISFMKSFIGMPKSLVEENRSLHDAGVLQLPSRILLFLR